jgi:hypothetical protein
VEDSTCIICMKPTRVARGAPPLDHTCTDHTGQVPPAVGHLRRILDPADLARAVEHNTARFAIELLTVYAVIFEERGRQYGRQMEGKHDRFDRTQVTELKGQRSASLECARDLRRTIRELELVTNPTHPDRPAD